MISYSFLLYIVKTSTCIPGLPDFDWQNSLFFSFWTVVLWEAPRALNHFFAAFVTLRLGTPVTLFIFFLIFFLSNSTPNAGLELKTLKSHAVQSARRLSLYSFLCSIYFFKLKSHEWGSEMPLWPLFWLSRGASHHEFLASLCCVHMSVGFLWCYEQDLVGSLVFILSLPL